MYWMGPSASTTSMPRAALHTNHFVVLRAAVGIRPPCLCS